MPRCVVSFVNTDLISHSVEVEAHSLYEAAALALAEFRATGFIEHSGPAIRLQIDVRRETRHDLTVEKVEAWLASSCKSPQEQAVKGRLRKKKLNGKEGDFSCQVG